MRRMEGLSSMRRPAAMLVAMLWLGTARVVAAQPYDGDAAVAPGQAGVEEAAPKVADGAPGHQDAAVDQPVVQTLGDGDQKLYVVNHDGTWSMHVESLITEELVRLWQEVGGPQVVAKTPLERPYTLSVHKLPAERIFERLLDGFDYTLHYDARGRLERVRVYSLDPSSASTFKTPRLVEGLGGWREVETAGASPAVSPAGTATASPAGTAPASTAPALPGGAMPASPALPVVPASPAMPVVPASPSMPAALAPPSNP